MPSFKNSRDIHVNAGGGEIGERAGIPAPKHTYCGEAEREISAGHTQHWGLVRHPAMYTDLLLDALEVRSLEASLLMMAIGEFGEFPGTNSSRRISLPTPGGSSYQEAYVCTYINHSIRMASGENLE
jgi:hypothetical protein